MRLAKQIFVELVQNSRSLLQAPWRRVTTAAFTSLCSARINYTFIALFIEEALTRRPFPHPSAKLHNRTMADEMSVDGKASSPLKRPRSESSSGDDGEEVDHGTPYQPTPGGGRPEKDRLICDQCGLTFRKAFGPQVSREIMSWWSSRSDRYHRKAQRQTLTIISLHRRRLPEVPNRLRNYQ